MVGRQRLGRPLRIEICEDRRMLSLNVPALNGLPGAPATIYLDFDGNFESQWGGFQNITTPAYDTDGDLANFSATELNEITDIWSGVVEDFAPFNVNVTTVDPGAFPDGVAVHVAIGGSYTDWFGTAASGTSFIFSFINPLPNTVFVFEDNLQVPRQVADIASHESGHAFGLFHQSVWQGGVKTQEFNPGNPPNWGPIMGNPLLSVRSTWFNGTSSISPTSLQDDIAVIGSANNGFGFRADDHGDDTLSATPLVPVGSAISGTGIVGDTSDNDYFSFTTGAGQISLTADVASFGANLDSRLELRDASGALVASDDPSSSLSASITTTVSAGTYYAVVGSHGNFGDLGQYTLSGTIVPLSNQSPTADAGGPYTINEGDSLSLDATASFDPDLGDVLSYSWDVNDDGVFGDAVGATPVLSWSQLVGLGIDDGDQTFNVRVRVDDGQGGVDISSPTTLTVQNVAPAAILSGPATAVPGQTRTFTLTANDPSPVDQAANFTFFIDYDGDLVPDETVVGPSGTTVDHVFTDLETATISVFAEDQDQGQSQTVSTTIDVTRFAIQPDETDPSIVNLAWGGTSGFDVVFFLPNGQNKISIFVFALDNNIVGTLDIFSGINGTVSAYGLGFGDVIIADALSTNAVSFDGGDGADLLIGGTRDDLLLGGDGADTLVGGMGDDQLYGGDGNDLILGEAGEDLLLGEDGRDILVGGADFDALLGGDGDDLLIGGTTTLDLLNGDFVDVQSEWNSSDDYATRVANLLGTGGSGSGALVPGDNLSDDEVIDLLYGEDDLDWFLASLTGDIVFDAESGEILTEIDP